MFHDVDFKWLVLYWIFLASASADFNPYSDNILFHVNWPGTTTGQTAEDSFHHRKDENTMVMTTADNEKYQCTIPTQIKEKFARVEENYYGPSAKELIAPLQMTSKCSYRIESYWTYELCHGKHLRQYHERQEAGKTPHVQEYFLGYFTKDHEDIKDEEQISGDNISHKQIPTIKLDGLDFAYQAVNMTGGTVCDVTNKHRRATLMYICHMDGKGEIFEIKEVSSCEYELIIFTKTLCAHPLYKPKSFHVNSIECRALSGSPVRPVGLDALEIENTLGRYRNAQKFHEMEAEKKQPDIPNSPAFTSTSSAKASKQILADFLRGDYCVTGGTGWWKYEFCFGKRVSQYHEEKGIRTTIVLGRWNIQEHMSWRKKNSEMINNLPHKPIVNFYSNGDNCDLTNKPREVEVRLKCKDDPKRPHAMAISLAEPRSCHYILTVESNILCSIMDRADDYGIISQDV
ncbi:endoplasmic reticulum lectin 1-like isoform X2 [Tubulanus polymorphus]|uniref:endoplasmic reticulum lectin 1-like isoform X2 n=1 Tax=Tubulanus polymorphus TaxID=672921 RepID=UPI003DA45188